MVEGSSATAAAPANAYPMPLALFSIMAKPDAMVLLVRLRPDVSKALTTAIRNEFFIIELPFYFLKTNDLIMRLFYIVKASFSKCY